MANRPPQVKGHLLWGNLHDFNRDSLRFLEKAAQCGDVVSIRFALLTGYFVNHPDYVRNILSTDSQSYQKPALVSRALSDITGKNIFTGNGDFWKHKRKLMQPAFHAQHIADYVDTIVQYTQQELESWQNGAEITLDAALTGLTMRVIIKTMFGAELNAETQEIGEIFSELFKLVYARMQYYALAPAWFPTADNRRIKHLTQRLRQIIRSFIDKRRSQKDSPHDLLSMLLSARYDDGNPMSDEQIMREALTVFGAGYETTAYAIVFACYALSRNPDVTNKLFSEIDTVLNGRVVRLHDLSQLTYTEMVIKEALRLYPTAWGFSRSTVKNVEIGGYHIPKNSTILISPWTLGRDSRWFEYPLEFQPERFHTNADFPRYAYLPFGGGARICIGNQLAMMEAQIILAMIAQRYRFYLPDGFYPAPTNAAFTLRPDIGMKMRLEKRQPIPVYG